MTITDIAGRSGLAEGRSEGFSLSFAKLKDPDNLEVITPPLSPCKDYLNDAVYSEHTGKPYRAWGYASSKKDIFKDNPGWVWMAAKIMPKRNGSHYAGQAKDEKAFKENVAIVQEAMNKIETVMFGGTHLSVIELHGDYWSMKVPMFWCEWTYRISLYGLLLRSLIYYDGKEDIFKYLSSNKLDSADQPIWLNCLQKFKDLLNGHHPKDDWDKGSGWHDRGIQGFPWPKYSPKPVEQPTTTPAIEGVAK